MKRRHSIASLATAVTLLALTTPLTAAAQPSGKVYRIGFIQAAGADEIQHVIKAQQFRRAAVYVDKIFKGAKPGDLPVEQPTMYEPVLNVRTAKTLGLTISSSLRLRADHIVE